jgi:hypothetical protein
LVCLRNCLEVTLTITRHGRSPRRASSPVLKLGLIEFSGGGAIPCAVKNLSASGAALEFESALDIPDRLTLPMPPEPIKRQCHVVWRDQKRIGVSFE